MDPEDLEHATEEQLLEAMAGTPVPPVDPAPVDPPADPDPTPNAELPAWLSEIPEDQRVGVAERYLNTLSPEQRLQLPTVIGLVNSAYEQGGEHREQQIVDTTNEQTRAQELQS